MIGKHQYWQAIKMKCQDCKGDSKDDSVCRDMAGHGECPLFVYQGNPKRRGPDGKMLDIFRKKTVQRRMREACVICMNGNPLNLCRAYTCPIYPIVFEKRKTSKDGTFSEQPSDRRPEAPSDTDTTSKGITAGGNPLNLSTSADTEGVEDDDARNR